MNFREALTKAVSLSRNQYETVYVVRDEQTGYNVKFFPYNRGIICEYDPDDFTSGTWEEMSDEEIVDFLFETTPEWKELDND